MTDARAHEIRLKLMEVCGEIGREYRSTLDTEEAKASPTRPYDIALCDLFEDMSKSECLFACVQLAAVTIQPFLDREVENDRLADAALSYLRTVKLEGPPS